MENIDILWMFVVVFAVVITGMVIVPKLKSKGIIKEEDVNFTGQLLEIVALIMSEVKFKDDKTKEKGMAIIDITRVAVKYVENVMKDDATIEDKRSMAIMASMHALSKLGIDITEERKKIIEITVDAMMKYTK